MALVLASPLLVTLILYASGVDEEKDLNKDAHPAGSFLNYPFVTAKTVQQEVGISRGNAIDVDVSLSYDKKEFAGAPESVVVKMIKPQGQFALLPSAQALPKEQLAEQLKVAGRSVEPTRAFFLDIGTLVSYPSGGEPIVLNAGETKIVKMKIEIPSDFPEELLNNKLKVNPGFTTDSTLVKGMTSGPLVTINKN